MRISCGPLLGFSGRSGQEKSEDDVRISCEPLLGFSGRSGREKFDTGDPHEPLLACGNGTEISFRE